MALSIISLLCQDGEINQDRLATDFALRHKHDAYRGYGPGMHVLLQRLNDGQPWREASTSQFAGQGSFGNGAAMRVAPLGAYFADSLETVVEQAQASAEVTHAHPEGIAGAIAVAVAAAWAWRLREHAERPTRSEFIDVLLPSVPESEVRTKCARRAIWVLESLCSLQPRNWAMAASFPLRTRSRLPSGALGNIWAVMKRR